MKKKMQTKLVSGYTEENYGWLECNTDQKRAAAIFNMREQMIETSDCLEETKMNRRGRHLQIVW